MRGGITPFACPVFILQNCKIKSGELPYFQFTCFRSLFESPSTSWHGEGRRSSFLDSVLAYSDFTHRRLEMWKKSHFFNIFLSLLPDAQCHFPLQASMSVVTCLGETCCDPMGQAQYTEDVRVKCTVLRKHVGPSSVRGPERWDFSKRPPSITQHGRWSRELWPRSHLQLV